jgi:hypothetical protein
VAEEVQIAGTKEVAKVRNPLGVIGLSLITLGIYQIVWYYKINKEMAAIGQAHDSEEGGTSPGTSVLAVTLGAMIVVPALVSIFHTWKRLNAVERMTGVPQGIGAVPGFLLQLVISPVGLYLMQASLNKVVAAQGGPAMAGAVAPAAA